MYSYESITRPVRKQNEADSVEPQVWESGDLSEIPDWVYTSEKIYAREVERIFHGPVWNYVGLEAEIPNVGDFRRTYVGPTPVLMVRNGRNEVSVIENRCAHRGAQFCRLRSGNTSEFVCPYHQWTYNLEGDLIGVPFKRGIKGKGGMPKSFRSDDHGVRRLHVTTHNGVVFAAFQQPPVTVEEFITPGILEDFDAVFTGEPLRILGYYRNEVPCNWKLYHENLKDPYHATLLHSFLVVFGLLVAGNDSLMKVDEVHGIHGTMASAKKDEKYAKLDETSKSQMRSFKDKLKLKDERFIDYFKEFDSKWSVTMQTIWPNLIVQREMNTLGVRHIVPNGPNSMVMIWTMFGYEKDDESMQRHRLRQGNLMGPAGFLGLEDNEAMKFVQEGLGGSLEGKGLVALDEGVTGTTETLISEAAIRSMYKFYRQQMGI